MTHLSKIKGLWEQYGLSGPISAIRPGLPCGQGLGKFFSRGPPPQDNSVGSGEVWVMGLFSLWTIELFFILMMTVGTYFFWALNTWGEWGLYHVCWSPVSLLHQVNNRHDIWYCQYLSNKFLSSCITYFDQLYHFVISKWFKLKLQNVS